METSPQGRAVRVWLGYALPTLAPAPHRQKLYDQLGQIFIPATVQFMGPLGLQAYIPSIVPTSRHAAVPDEIALVFYPDQATYESACHESCGGRAYASLHSTVFSFSTEAGRPASHSAFPAQFRGDPSQTGAIQVLDHGESWQSGRVISEVMARTEQTPEVFRGAVCNRFTGLLEVLPTGLSGVFLYLDDDLCVCWSLWTGNPQPLAEGLGERALLSESVPSSVPPSPFARYAGLHVQAGDSLNLQFATRPAVSAPAEEAG